MWKKITDYFLGIYKNENFILQRKAQIFFVLCFVCVISIFIFPLYSIVGQKNITPQLIIPLACGLVVSITLLWCLKKGYFFLTAHGMVIGMSAMVWTIMFTDKLEPLSQVDSISYILGVLAITSLTVTRRKLVIIFYMSLNIALLVAYVLFQMNLGYFSKTALMDYLVDNSFAFVIITIICFLFSSITQQALDKADNEIRLNVELNQNLDAKVRERTGEFEAAMGELASTNQQLVTMRDKLWSEIEIAQKIQAILLPRNPSVEGYEVAAYMNPAQEVGGDYYDVINTEKADWVIIGDVAGHGVPAGLIMMMAQTSIQTAIRTQPDGEPTAVLEAVNRAIAHNVNRIGENKYMTITALKFKGSSVDHAGFHEQILVYRADSNLVEQVETVGIWLGVSFVSPYNDRVSHFTVGKGDIVLLYTDGVTEAFVETTEHQYGVERLGEELKMASGLPPQQIIDRIMRSLEGYTVCDDATVMVLKKD